MSFRQCHRQHCRMIKLKHDRDYIEDARKPCLALMHAGGLWVKLWVGLSALIPLPAREKIWWAL
jgi:hypothetical protein